MGNEKKNNKLPEELKPLFWSYDFDKIDPADDRVIIVTQIINYGKWEQWRWLVNFYGKDAIKKIIETVPASQFRLRALKLISLLLNIERLNYAPRGARS